MSNSRSNTYTYRTTTRTTTRSSTRTTLGYWVPLVLTVTAASVALGAWIWSERSDGDDSPPEHDGGYDSASSSDAAYARRLAQERRSYDYTEEQEEDVSYGVQENVTSVQRREGESEDTWISRVQGIVRRSPSPQQMFDGASRRVAQGMSYLGKGLRSISEEKEGFEDHERWSEEAEDRERQGVLGGAAAAAVGLGGAAAAAAASSAGKRGERVGLEVPGGRKRTVAVVVSAEDVGSAGVDEGSWSVEHVSILSHLIGTINPDGAELLILVYAPQLAAHPLSRPSRRASSSGASGYEAIDAPIEGEDERSGPDGGPLFQALQTQAQSLLRHPAHLLPFTTPTGHVHLLRHLAPSLVYVQESLAGSAADGEVVKQIDGWVGQVVVVVGAEGAGLADTETEDEGGPGAGRRGGRKWWMDERRVGLGKGVEIVDSTRVGEDWVKRVEEA